MADDEAEPVAKHPRRDTPPVFVSKGCGHAAVVLYYFFNREFHPVPWRGFPFFAHVSREKK